MRLSCSIAATRSDSLRRTCRMFSSTVSPFANVPSVERIGSMSGMSRQSTRTPRSSTPSCFTRTALRVCVVTPSASPISRTISINAPFGMVGQLARQSSASPRNSTSDGMNRRRRRARRPPSRCRAEARPSPVAPAVRARLRSAASPARCARADRTRASSRPSARCTGARSARPRPR